MTSSTFITKSTIILPTIPKEIKTLIVKGESSEVAYQILPVGLGIPDSGGVHPPEVPTEITTVIPTIADYSSCNTIITNNNCIFSSTASCSTIPVATPSSNTTKCTTSVTNNNSSSSNDEGTVLSTVPTSDTTATTSSLTITRCFGIYNEGDKTIVGSLITSPSTAKQEIFTGACTTICTNTTNSDSDVLCKWTDIPLGTNPKCHNTREAGVSNRYLASTSANNITIDDTNKENTKTTCVVNSGYNSQAASTVLTYANIGNGTSFGVGINTNNNNSVDILNVSTSPGYNTSSSSTTILDSTSPNNYYFDTNHFFPNLGFNQQLTNLPSTPLELVDVDLQEDQTQISDSKPSPLPNRFLHPAVSNIKNYPLSCPTTLYSKSQNEHGINYNSCLSQSPSLSYNYNSNSLIKPALSSTVTYPNQYNYSQSQTDPCSSPNADGNTTIARRLYTTGTPTSLAATCSGTISSNSYHKKHGKSSCKRSGGGNWVENNVNNNSNSSGSESCSGTCCCSGSNSSCCCSSISSSSDSSPDNDITVSRNNNRRKKKGNCRVGGGSVSFPVCRRSRFEDDRNERRNHRKSGQIVGGEGVSVVRVGGTNNTPPKKTYAPFSSLASNSSTVGFNNSKDVSVLTNNSNNNNSGTIEGFSAVDSFRIPSKEREEGEEGIGYYHKLCNYSYQHCRQQNVPKFAASSDDNDVEEDNGDERELRKREAEENGLNHEEEEEEEEEEGEEERQQLLVSNKYRNNPPKKTDTQYNRWWGTRKNRRWWSVVGRGLKKTKKQKLQELQDLEIEDSRPDELAAGGGGRLGVVTPYSTTSSSSVVVVDDDGGGDDPHHPLHRHLYYKQITGAPGSQQQQDCHRYGHHHHHHHQQQQQQQQTIHHHCRHLHPQPQESNKICHHHHHHHHHQQHREGDGDGEPPDLQNLHQHYRHHHRHRYHRHHKDHYCRYNNIHGGAADDDDDEEEEGNSEEELVDKSGGRRRRRFRRGQGEAVSGGAAITMESCAQCLKNEFKPENAGLNHDDPSVFVRSQWPLDHRIYVLYRVVVALGFIAWIIADIIDETEKFYKDRFWIWFIFATNWSFILLTVTTIFEAICSTYYLVAARGLVDQQYFQEIPICLKIQWLLYNLGANTAIVITISYWSFIFFMEHSKFLMTNMSKMKHMLNTVYVVLDIFISATPIRIFHMLFPIMLGSIYAIFNATYFLNDGTILDGRHYAYNVLNWNVPAEAIVTCILCIAQTIFSQIILYHLAALRKWIHSKIYKPREPIPEHDSEMQSIMSADSTTYLATDSQNEATPGSIH